MLPINPLASRLALLAANTITLTTWRELAAASYFAGSGARYVKIDSNDQPLPETATETEHDWSATYDCATDITWQIRSSAKAYRNNGPAEKFVRKLTTLNRTDWRVPEVEALESIRNLSSYPARPNPQYFPGVKTGWHWSSSPIPGDEDYARVVGFSDGGSGSYHRSDVYPVLACCGGVVGAAGVVSPGQ